MVYLSMNISFSPICSSACFGTIHILKDNGNEKIITCMLDI
jgi:hypothetical protein